MTNFEVDPLVQSSRALRENFKPRNFNEFKDRLRLILTQAGFRDATVDEMLNFSNGRRIPPFASDQMKTFLNLTQSLLQIGLPEDKVVEVYMNLKSLFISRVYRNVLNTLTDQVNALIKSNASGQTIIEYLSLNFQIIETFHTLATNRPKAKSDPNPEHPNLERLASMLFGIYTPEYAPIGWSREHLFEILNRMGQLVNENPDERVIFLKDFVSYATLFFQRIDRRSAIKFTYLGILDIGVEALMLHPRQEMMDFIIKVFDVDTFVDWLQKENRPVLKPLSYFVATTLRTCCVHGKSNPELAVKYAALIIESLGNNKRLTARGDDSGEGNGDRIGSFSSIGKHLESSGLQDFELLDVYLVLNEVWPHTPKWISDPQGIHLLSHLIHPFRGRPEVLRRIGEVLRILGENKIEVDHSSSEILTSLKELFILGDEIGLTGSDLERFFDEFLVPATIKLIKPWSSKFLAQPIIQLKNIATKLIKCAKTLDEFFSFSKTFIVPWIKLYGEVPTDREISFFEAIDGLTIKLAGVKTSANSLLETGVNMFLLETASWFSADDIEALTLFLRGEKKSKFGEEFLSESWFLKVYQAYYGSSTHVFEQEMSQLIFEMFTYVLPSIVKCFTGQLKSFNPKHFPDLVRLIKNKKLNVSLKEVLLSAAALVTARELACDAEEFDSRIPELIEANCAIFDEIEKHRLDPSYALNIYRNGVFATLKIMQEHNVPITHDIFIGILKRITSSLSGEVVLNPADIRVENDLDVINLAVDVGAIFSSEFHFEEFRLQAKRCKALDLSPVFTGEVDCELPLAERNESKFLRLGSHELTRVERSINPAGYDKTQHIFQTLYEKAKERHMGDLTVDEFISYVIEHYNLERIIDDEFDDIVSDRYVSYITALTLRFFSNGNVPKLEKGLMHDASLEAREKVATYLSTLSILISHTIEQISQYVHNLEGVEIGETDQKEAKPVESVFKEVLAELLEMNREIEVLLNRSKSRVSRAIRGKLIATKEFIDCFYGDLGDCCITSVYGNEITRDDFQPIRIVNDRGAIVGYIYALTHEVFGSKSLVLAGIEPNWVIKYRLEPREFTRNILKAVVNLANKCGITNVFVNAGSYRGEDDGRISQLSQIRHEIKKNFGSEILTLDKPLHFPAQFELPIHYAYRVK
ncbi:MAG: hypothetical protein NZT61_03925 [Deltaproteobacteria bacterium]|nr:hypothetical protein [Deltaproteobacteria bacterium]